MDIRPPVALAIVLLLVSLPSLAVLLRHWLWPRALRLGALWLEQTCLGLAAITRALLRAAGRLRGWAVELEGRR